MLFSFSSLAEAWAFDGWTYGVLPTLDHFTIYSGAARTVFLFVSLK